MNTSDLIYSEAVHEQRRQITREIVARKHGEVVEVLKEGGHDYRVNLGVPYSDLQVIARNQKPGAAISQILWDKEWREMRIVSCVLAEPNALGFNQVLQRIKEAQSSELLEFVALFITSKREDAFNELQLLLSQGDAFFTAGLYTSIRLGIQCKDQATGNQLVKLLLKYAELSLLTAEHTNLLAKGLSRAAVKSTISFEEIEERLNSIPSSNGLNFIIDTVKTEIEYR